MSDPQLEDLSRDVDEAVRLRARLVQDVLSLGPARAAREHGVTRQTAAKWAQRYRTGGAAQLSRPAHRRRTTQELRHAALTAPLWMPTTKWSSRSIADALGVSQSFVARAWEAMRSGTAFCDDLTAAAAGRQPAVLGLLVTSEYVVLAVQLTPVAPREDAAAPARVDPAVHRSLRAALVSDLVRPGVPAISAADTGPFWEEVAEAADPGATLMAVASAPAPVPAEVSVRATCRDVGEWLSLFSSLVEWGALLSPTSALQLENDLRAWARAPRRAFTWVRRPSRAGGGRGPATRSAARHPGPERVLADEIVLTIRQGVAEGRLAGGDRVTERYLAGRLRTTRGQVRTALRLLERDGLLTITTGHAAVVPVLTTNDVVETYAARRALGTLVIRAAVRWSPQERQSVEDALDALERWAATGDVHRTGEADIAFQNTLAEASGLVRIAPMLEVLADHLRMFIAVMGLDYAYPIDAMVRDDRAIFEAIDAGDGEVAAERWRVKIDDAAAYMLRQLSATRSRPARRP
ncbi:DNA-binding transcriptional regulator, GntR family [Geodermatophilus saharensis]|uniref:DNA-binding transcriptional regulator, GntR family n=1 Tax=Geodermatophilus saharensis TaxID=1137994 RepID=A0A239C3C6_9ACTN|nr:FCD domain-containing protein [Geodermatophilus saharensis]SNS14640.1 DNA-binding transcriptional regulator, GntR family [Geodermatophilus saharensis]